MCSQFSSQSDFYFLKCKSGEFPGGLVVRTRHFHCHGLDSTKIPQAARRSQKKKKKSKSDDVISLLKTLLYCVLIACRVRPDSLFMITKLPCLFFAYLSPHLFPCPTLYKCTVSLLSYRLCINCLQKLNHFSTSLFTFSWLTPLCMSGVKYQLTG